MIYLLEDDGNIRNFVLYALNNSGLEAKGFEHPSLFWDALREEMPQLILLDIMLPEEDGMSILKKLRQWEATSKIPVMMLTAKSSEYDKVVGLDSGADDYVTKPFGTLELLSRVKALLRRMGSSARPQTEEYRVGDLSVSVTGHTVRISDRDVILTFKEFELLCLLLRNAGAVLTREQILQKIWGYDFDGENRTVDVHIRTLRAKLGPCGKLIETIRGIGYKIGDLP